VSAGASAVRRLAGHEVSAIGLGCMSLSHAYGMPPSADDGAAVLRAALDLGYTHFDTAAIYGDGANERLIGGTFGGARKGVLVATKCGMTIVDGKRAIDGRPESLARTIDASLAYLGIETIDLLYLHRWDKAVPIEESIGAMARAGEAGKVRALGLSEVSAATLRRAHAVHPIAAVQSEYSLWSRAPEHGLLAALRELGGVLVAFSPIGRGFLGGSVADPAALAPGDLRLGMPRFQAAAFEANRALLARYCALADEAGCTPGQLALAWLLSRGEDVLPIPGTTNPARLAENLAAATLAIDPAILARAGDLVRPETVAGERYTAATLAETDTERA